jgi:riboflavin synthase
VTGHVDAVSEVISVSPDGDSTRVIVRVPETLGPMIAPKGSITLDGVSLTVNEVLDTGGDTHVSVNIIPHTAEHTTLGDLRMGQQLNVEIDVLARYLDRMLSVRAH